MGADELNPFQRHRLEAVPYAQRRKAEKAKLKEVASTPEAKREQEKIKLWELYLDELEKRRKALVSGPYAGTGEALIQFLKGITLEDGEKIVEMAMVWQGAPQTTRFLVMQIIDEAMINLRERNGLAPFDDPLPLGMCEPDEEPDNVFFRIKRILT
jgi:hypothetical protein